jgi:hypothetical protein
MLLALAGLFGCADRGRPHDPPPVALREQAEPVVITPDAMVPVVAEPDAVPAPSSPAPAPATKPAGFDFIDDARKLYRVAGCAEGPLTEALTKYAKAIDKHCKALAPFIARYRAAYFVGARKWFDKHVPADVPSAVVYLFAGADLVSALVAFPKATEITTLSLELAGDPRRLPALTPDELDQDLAAFRREIGMLIWVGSNSSKNLSSQQRRFLPGQVSSFLLGLATGGYEPVAMRFFRIDDAGKLHYLEQADIESDTKTTSSLRGTWNKPAFAESFRHVELAYRKIGETEVRTHRHIAWNLEDKYLAEHPGLLRHLEAKGKVTMLVKGGSYMLWLGGFKTIRTYILGHLQWMLSDSTGVPPTHARPAGMVQEPFGRFNGPIQAIFANLYGKREDLDMRALFKNAKPMPFRFGYLDNDDHNHVIITRPK